MGAKKLLDLYKELEQQNKVADEKKECVESLLLIHPCTGLLGEDLTDKIKKLWGQREIDFNKFHSGRISTSKYSGPVTHMPVSLWGYLNQNDCKYLRPIGDYLDQHLKSYYAPLLLPALILKNQF